MYMYNLSDLNEKHKTHLKKQHEAQLRQVLNDSGRISVSHHSSVEMTHKY